MKIIYYVAHPSQYYIFKNIAENISKDTEFILVYTDKDVIKAQIANDEIPYKQYEIGSKKKIFFKSLCGFVEKEIDLYRIVKKEKPILLMGTSVILAHVGKFLKIPVLILNEDDLEVISLSARIGYPFVEGIITPKVCKLGKFEKKAYKYDGYQKLAYLHPKYFTPDINIAEQYINIKKNNFLIRLSALSAHHDIGVKGINNKQINEIINFLNGFGTIHISSERKLPNALEDYRLKINPLHLHHVLNYADLLISDSQSMSVESALLGIPSVRISDFAGRISVLEELEKKYKLTFAVKPNQFHKVIHLIRKEIFIDNYQDVFKKRRNNMLAEKIDVIPFFIKTIFTIIKKRHPDLYSGDSQIH